MHMRTIMALATGLVLTACAARDADDATASTSDTADTSDPTSDLPTTGAAVDPCDPALLPIPEADFAERFAAEICAQKSACGCDVAFSCPFVLLVDFDVVRQSGANLGLTYDGACAARKLAGLLQARGCAMASAIDLSPPCTIDCLVYRGATPLGGACTLPPKLLTAFLADTCAAPNRCDGSTCKAPSPVVADGQPCVTPLARCQAGSACDYLGSRVCETQVGAGASCLGASVCSPQLYCADGLCDARKSADQPCAAADECEARRCTAGKCEDWPWICEVRDSVDIFGRHPDDF